MIKRYEAYAVEVSGDSPWVSHEEDGEGEWVRYDDHAAELAALRAESERLRSVAGSVIDDINEVVKESYDMSGRDMFKLKRILNESKEALK